MDARGLQATETIPASRKLGREDAQALLDAATRLIVAKGKSLERFELPDAAAIETLLGRTGNLRAPTLVVGDTLLVGFNEDAWAEVFD